MATNTHANLINTERHSPYRQVFTNAAARIADAETYTSDDLYKISYQISTSEEYVLTSIAPTTWTIVTVNGGGGENLAATLAIGNATAGNDISMSDDDFLIMGDNDEVSISHISAQDFLVIGGTVVVSTIGAGSDTSGVIIQSRPVTQTDAIGSVGTGSISISSGITDTTGGGTTASTGNIEVKSGNASATAGTSGDTGNVSIKSGNSASTSSGNVSISTGTGPVDSGTITISTGNSSDISGNLTISTGNGTATSSGNVSITTGTTGGTRGDIDLNSREVSITTDVIDLLSNTTTIDCSASDVVLNIDGTSVASFSIEETSASGSWVAFDPAAGTGPELRIGLADSEIVADSTGALAGSNTQTTIFNKHTDVFLEGVNLTSRIVLEHNFDLLPQTTASDAHGFDPYWFINGVNSGDAFASLSSGRLRLDTNIVGAGDNTVVYAGFRPSKFAASGGGWHGSGLPSIGTYLINFDLTNSRVEFGIRGTPTALDDTTDNDKMILRAIHAGGAANWFLVTSNGGVDTVTSTGVAATGSDFIRMTVNSSREVTVILNNIVVLTGAVNTLGANDLGAPYYGIETTDGAIKSLFIGKFFGAYVN